MKAKFSVVIILVFTLGLNAHAIPNSWFAGSGKWETGGNWSLGIPPASTQSILITNTGHNTVTIDAVTTNSPATMSISNLTVNANSLLLTSIGTNTPLVLAGFITVSTNASLVVSNAVLQDMGSAALVNGSMSVNSGLFVATNGLVTVSSMNGVNSTITMNGGLALLNATTLTSGTGSRTTWSILGATNKFFNALSVGNAGTATFLALSGQVLALSGQALATNNFIGGQFNVGDAAAGRGTLLISNADVEAMTYRFGNFGSGTLTLNGGTITATSNLLVGVNVGSTGFIFVNGGTMLVTNSTHTGTIDVRRGAFILSNGIVCADIFVATNAAMQFINAGGTLVITTQARMDQGTQVVSGGMSQMLSNLVVASTATSTGIVNLTGGSLTVTNGVLGVGNNGDVIGDGGFGSLAVSNATVLAKSIVLGSTLGGHGIMTLKSGGVLQFPGILASNCTDCGLSLNEAILDGGEIDAANVPFFAGRSRPGELIISNGAATFLSGYVGIDNPGTLEMDGGVVTLLSNVVVGDCSADIAGSVTIAGGNLYVTNAAHNAVLDIRDGVFALNSGLVQVDVLVMTNSCGLFVHNGGTLVYSATVLDPNGDSDGDGIPNGYEQSHGLDPFNAADASADNDGDGFTNLQEFQAGTDPNDAGSSPLNITSILQQNNDILITWSTFAGTTNALQATLGAADGGYATDGFCDVFVVTNALGNVTNYLDSGALTNSPAKYYRLRLVP